MQNENISELKIEYADDGTLMLEQQNGFENPDCIIVHRLHVRHLAEKLGLIATIAPDAQRTIAMLERRLLLLNDRIEHMANWLANHSDAKHADLSYEQTYATATADIAAEFCADLTDKEMQRDAEPECRPAPDSTQPGKTSGKAASEQPSLL